MGEYFKPWRRKIGVLTLVLASVFAGGWVRTYYAEDIMNVPFGSSASARAISYHSKVVMQVYPQASSFRINSGLRRTVAAPLPWDDHDRVIDWSGWWGGGIAYDANDHEQEREKWRRQVRLWGCGLFIRSKAATGHPIVGIELPYWSIVAPLTLLSAWLLMSNLRQRNDLMTVPPISRPAA